MFPSLCRYTTECACEGLIDVVSLNAHWRLADNSFNGKVTSRFLVRLKSEEPNKTDIEMIEKE